MSFIQSNACARYVALIPLSLGLLLAGCGPSASDAAQKSPSLNTSGEIVSIDGPVRSAFKANHVDAMGARKLLATATETIVLDVRTQKEIDGGYIEGAIFANFYEEDFAQKLSKLDRNKPYLVHCKGGGRSTKTLGLLKDLGFTNITHLDGGLDGWKRAKLPLVMP